MTENDEDIDALPKPKKACWLNYWKDQGLPEPGRQVSKTEELTPNQIAEREASNALLAQQQPLGTQRPEIEPEPKDDEEALFEAHFLQVWGTGWHEGYYTNLSKASPFCYFRDPEDRRIWQDGLDCGKEARKTIEKKPENAAAAA